MRKKLINLLRKLEEQSGFKNEYKEFFESEDEEYSVTEHLDFPDYRLVIAMLNGLPSGHNANFQSNNIRAELKRMEADGLVMISVQEGTKSASPVNGHGPDYDEGVSFKTESIVLTTKGKSNWKYFIHEATENPVTTILSMIAIIISIFALFI